MIAAIRSIALVAALLALFPASGAAQGARQRALALFEDSTTAYREGRFSEAAAALTEAYELFPEPVLLYNLARALEADGQLAPARDSYEDFLEESPDAEQAPAAQRRLEVLAQMIAERDALRAAAEATPEPVTVAPAPIEAPPPRVSGPDTTGPWLLFAGSTAVTITGAILVGVASATYDAASTEAEHARAASLEREAYTFRDVGVALLVVGAALMTTSVVWLIVASGESGDSVAVALGPTSLSMRASF